MPNSVNVWQVPNNGDYDNLRAKVIVRFLHYPSQFCVICQCTVLSLSHYLQHTNNSTGNLYLIQIISILQIPKVRSSQSKVIYYDCCVAAEAAIDLAVSFEKHTTLNFSTIIDAFHGFVSLCNGVQQELPPALNYSSVPLLYSCRIQHVISSLYVIIPLVLHYVNLQHSKSSNHHQPSICTQP